LGIILFPSLLKSVNHGGSGRGHLGGLLAHVGVVGAAVIVVRALFVARANSGRRRHGSRARRLEREDRAGTVEVVTREEVELSVFVLGNISGLTSLLTFAEDGAESVEERTEAGRELAKAGTAEGAKAVDDVGVSSGTTDDDTADGATGDTASLAVIGETTPGSAAVVSGEVTAAGGCFVVRGRSVGVELVAVVVDLVTTAGTDRTATTLASAGVDNQAGFAIIGGRASLRGAEAHARASGEVVARGNATGGAVVEIAFGEPVAGLRSRVDDKVGEDGDGTREEGPALGGGCAGRGLSGGIGFTVGVDTSGAMLAVRAGRAFGGGAADASVDVELEVLNASRLAGASVAVGHVDVEGATERLAGAASEGKSTVGASAGTVEGLSLDGEGLVGAGGTGTETGILVDGTAFAFSAAVVHEAAGVAGLRAAFAAGITAHVVQETG